MLSGTVGYRTNFHAMVVKLPDRTLDDNSDVNQLSGSECVTRLQHFEYSFESLSPP
jgi:hypothetical protein